MTERRNSPRSGDGEVNLTITPEDRYRKIFEHDNDAVMIVDLETESFLDVNPAAYELLNYSRKELLSIHPEDINPDDSAASRRSPSPGSARRARGSPTT